MTRLIGYNALLVALAIAVFGLVATPIGVRRKSAELVNGSYSAVYTMFGLTTAAVFAITVVSQAYWAATGRKDYDE